MAPPGFERKVSRAAGPHTIAKLGEYTGDKPPPSWAKTIIYSPAAPTERSVNTAIARNVRCSLVPYSAIAAAAMILAEALDVVVCKVAVIV